MISVNRFRRINSCTHKDSTTEFLYNNETPTTLVARLPTLRRVLNFGTSSVDLLFVAGYDVSAGGRRECGFSCVLRCSFLFRYCHAESNKQAIDYRILDKQRVGCGCVYYVAKDTCFMF
jgi:hypothetical protein